MKRIERLEDANAGMLTGITVWRVLELLAVLTVALSILGLVALRLNSFSALPIWCASFLLTYLYAYFFSSRNDPVRDQVPFWQLFVVLALALIFRLPPFTYMLGGQDQGVYLNMAAHLVNTGGLTPVDHLVDSFMNPAARDAYIQSNYNVSRSEYLPGVYSTESGLVFQFYHLFPVWLAIFGGVLGMDGAGYALTFLSVLSVLFLQRLAFLLTGKTVAGLVVGVLLAANPLHVFFSKFSATELPALAFSAMSFTFLLAYWRLPSVKTDEAKTYLALSVASMSMLFLTRISGFMYIPFVGGLLFLALLVKDIDRRRGVICWGVSVLAVYVVSVAYGLIWSYPYSHAIYTISFGRTIGEHWALILPACGMVMLGAWFLLSKIAAKNRQAMADWASFGGRLLPLLIIPFTLIAAWKAYRLGYTDHYTDFTFAALAVGKGFDSVRATSLFAAAGYLSPFMVLAFIFGIFRSYGYLMTLLVYFVISFFGYVAVLQWVLPYQPYYARYLLSEFVPYLVVFVACFWSSLERGWRKRFVTAMLLLAGAYSVFFSSQQIGKSEHEGLARTFDRLTSSFDPKDLVLIEATLGGPSANELSTTLSMFYGLNVARVFKADLGPTGFATRLAGAHHDVYYITSDEVPPEGFSEFDSVDYLERVFCHGITLPTTLCTRVERRLMIHKRLPDNVSSGPRFALVLGVDDSRVATQVGVKNGRELAATGAPGFIMHGPYAPMSAGDYLIDVFGEASTPFILEVVSSRGANRIERKEFASSGSAGGGSLARLEFSLTEPVEDLEIRLQVPAQSDMRISGYELIRH